MARGKVETYDSKEGYGFIIPDRAENHLYVHRTSILGKSGEVLNANQIVHFEVLDGKHGKQAVKVRPIRINPTRKEG